MQTRVLQTSVAMRLWLDANTALVAVFAMAIVLMAAAEECDPKPVLG